MSVLQGLILGLIQGITEFLPISSSGHLVIFQRLFGLHEGVLTFDIAVHVSTLIAVICVFRKDVIYIIKKPFGKLTLLIAAGTIPTVIMGLIFNKFFENLFESGATIGFEFLLTGVVLWYAENIKSKNKRLEKTTYLDAAIIGAAQGIAILPAVSRSGLTIAGALFRGLNREFAARFSFLISIPAILGAALLDVYKIIDGKSAGVEAMPVIVGMIAAGIAGYISIRFMMRLISRGSLKLFAVYVLLVGLLIIVEQAFYGKCFERLF
ncbi:MAG TPA: undecaprenyl-diphosphate phosphatase [Clostridia bacterium]|nr:undecaprenyl-diphosphate phosphatase [Clostridia bacterium]